MGHTESQKKTDVKQSISAKVIANPHKNASGANCLYLRVRIDKVKREFNLKEYWPAEKFDPVRERAMPRHHKDADVDTVNMVIDEAKARASRIKLKYYAERKALTMALFADEYENYESRDNFIFFWMAKQNEVYNKEKIGRTTYVRHNTNLERFKAFIGKNAFPMSELTPDLIQRYKQWLTNKKSDLDKTQKKKIKYNTVISALKCLQTYVNHAIEDGHRIPDPFKNISLEYRAGGREALDRDELKALRAHYADETTKGTEREVLRKFLFSCYTGLRVSDSKLVHRNMIRTGQLCVDVFKTRKQGKKVEIPITDYANHLIEGRKGMLFDEISDQKCNDYLKIIAHKCGIEKNLTFHVSRDTFATLFIEMGGDVFTLKELLGHSDIKTTQIYVKMSEKRKEKLMANFNDL